MAPKPLPGKTHSGSDPASLRVERMAGGCRFPIKVHPAARKNALVAILGGALKLSVTAPPERGKANGAVERFLAEKLGISRERVTVAAGHASRDKTVHVAGMSPEQVLERLHG